MKEGEKSSSRVFMTPSDTPWHGPQGGEEASEHKGQSLTEEEVGVKLFESRTLLDQEVLWKLVFTEVFCVWTDPEILGKLERNSMLWGKAAAHEIRCRSFPKAEVLLREAWRTHTSSQCSKKGNSSHVCVREGVWSFLFHSKSRTSITTWPWTKIEGFLKFIWLGLNTAERAHFSIYEQSSETLANQKPKLQIKTDNISHYLRCWSRQVCMNSTRVKDTPLELDGLSLNISSVVL